MVRVSINHIPTHPGEMLLEEFLNPRGVIPGTALRLAKFFHISADFWMNLQLRRDLYFAQPDEVKTLKTIHPFSA